MLTAFAALTLLLCAVSPAQDLAEARTAEAELDYQRAKSLVVGLLGRSDLSEQERLESHFLAGQIERILGNDAEARVHFGVVLSTRPQWALGPEIPPKVRTFFEQVRIDVQAGRLHEEVTASAPAAPPAVAAPSVVAPAATMGPILVGSAGMVIAAGFAVGVVGELMFSQTDVAFADRAVGRTVALTGWAGAGVGALVGVGGLALLVAGE